MSSATITAAGAQRRSQAERRDESERLLVEATLRVVAEQGVSAATFEEIGRAAGYSRGLATQRFGSKRGLTEAVIAYLHRQREAVIEAEHVADMPAFAAIARYIDGHMRALCGERSSRAYFMLLAAAVADPTSLLELFSGSHERVRSWLRAQVERGQAAGEISAEVNADAAALMIGSLMLGMSIQLLVDPTTDLETIKAEAIATLGRSLLAQALPSNQGLPSNQPLPSNQAVPNDQAIPSDKETP